MNGHNESSFVRRTAFRDFRSFADRAHQHWIYICIYIYLVSQNSPFTERSNHEVRLTARYFLFALIIYKIPDIPCHVTSCSTSRNNRSPCACTSNFVDLTPRFRRNPEIIFGWLPSSNLKMTAIIWCRIVFIHDSSSPSKLSYLSYISIESLSRYVGRIQL